MLAAAQFESGAAARRILFTWNQLSAVAGVNFWNIYFKLVNGAVRAPELVAFLKNLRPHSQAANSLSFGIVYRPIAAAWSAITSTPKAAISSWSFCRPTHPNSIPSNTCGPLVCLSTINSSLSLLRLVRCL